MSRRKPHRLAIAIGIKHQAAPFHVPTNPLSNLRRVVVDPSSEHNGISAIQRGKASAVARRLWNSVVVPFPAVLSCSDAGLRALDGAAVFAKGRGTVGPCPVIERLLAGLEIPLFAVPGFHRAILERPPIRKADFPWFRNIELVDGIQMDCGKDVALPARQEDNAGYGRWDMTT